MDIDTWIESCQFCSNIVIEKPIKDGIDAGWCDSDKVTNQEEQQMIVIFEDNVEQIFFVEI